MQFQSSSFLQMKNVGSVGLFIDFENLIYGLTHRYGEQGAFERFDLSIIAELCQEKGRLLIAKAYADWRMKSMNRYQSDLYTFGIELVHVLSRGQKNAVDVYLAVDIVEIALTLTHIDTFVIVSGDRDFVRALQVIRKYNKRIIVIAPKWSLSPDLKSLCDDFISYEDLMDPKKSKISTTKSLTEIKKAVFGILTVHEAGLTGAQLHQQLDRYFDGRFEPKDYGFVKFSKLLEQLEDDIDLSSEGGGDMLVKLKSNFDKTSVNHQYSEEHDVEDQGVMELSNPELIDEPTLIQLQMKSALDALKQYRFEQESKVRRDFLSKLFEVLLANENLSWQDLAPYLAERLNVSRTYLNKYHALLWQSQCFDLLGEDAPIKERSFKLSDRLSTEEIFIEHYEKSILLKASGSIPKMTTDIAIQLLGLEHLGEEHGKNYVNKLLLDLNDM